MTVLIQSQHLTPSLVGSVEVARAVYSVQSFVGAHPEQLLGGGANPWGGGTYPIF